MFNTKCFNEQQQQQHNNNNNNNTHTYEVLTRPLAHSARQAHRNSSVFHKFIPTATEHL
jgi:hypothetical protein